MNMTQQKHSNKINLAIFFLSHQPPMLSSLGPFQKNAALVFDAKLHARF